ncbi:MAG: helix-hairpin-helix domain-containing protein [Caldilinea sp. CFX5]|nr:helix-hairpin-helix domain-containing protein [Caldilinea sp. CFX5]
MKDCSTLSTANGTLPPNKRLNYTLGMVMGVDDFRQEQIHFEWKNSLSNLLLHGYGAVCGLAVTIDPADGDDDRLVRIAQGYGVSPKGHWLWVDREQCANLGAWIAANPPPADSPPAPPRVYVQLCYEECLTDLVPVAGRPCATDEDTRAPSRIHEAFQAQFTWTPPPQPAEDLARAFGGLLAQVVILDAVTSPVEDDRALLLAAVRALGEDLLGSPPLTSPPAGPFVLPAATACATLEEALAIWVTEICPRYHAAVGADCILLACIAVELNENNRLLVDSAALEPCDRPILVPSRLQQELLCLLSAHRITDHSTLANLDADDHPQYLRTDGTRPLTGDQSAGGHRITDLAEAAAAGQAMPYGQKAGGDLRGAYPDPLLQSMQGRAVAMPATGTRINDGNVLTWTANAWRPAAVPASPLPKLDDLTDVTAPTPTNDQVLSWNEGQRQWVPRTLPSGGSGPTNVVLRPAKAGAYAIVAAGIFDRDGNAFNPTTSYAGLNATPIGAVAGQYLLTFPAYVFDLAKVTYIVKGTILNDRLADLAGGDIDIKNLLAKEDELVEASLNNPNFIREAHPFPANFQVVAFTEEGIVVAITTPVLRPSLIQRMARGEFDNAEFGFQHFLPIAKPFMVEISAYGPALEEVLPKEDRDGGVQPPRRLDINRATADELAQLPGMNRALAERIVAERPAGGFATIDDLLRIRGMTAARLEGIRALITVG